MEECGRQQLHHGSMAMRKSLHVNSLVSLVACTWQDERFIDNNLQAMRKRSLAHPIIHPVISSQRIHKDIRYE
jgi:hypothetical protein